MKLRYYLRGLGIGMIVTALLMGVALKDNGSLSDTEIRVRAMALGMVEGESRTLADMQASQEPNQPPDDTAAPTGTVEPASEPVSTELPAATPIPRPSDRVVPNSSEAAVPDVEATSEPLPVLTPSPTPETLESVTFVIRSGQSSYGVSKSLVEAGLVEDASVFDQYLEDNGYSKRISTGTYEIPLEATPEEIAKIITRSR